MDSDKRLERIEEKLDSVHGHISDINITLVKQHESLVHHIKRTDSLEKLVYVVIAAFLGLALKILFKL